MFWEKFGGGFWLIFCEIWGGFGSDLGWYFGYFLRSLGMFLEGFWKEQLIKNHQTHKQIAKTYYIFLGGVVGRSGKAPRLIEAKLFVLRGNR